MSGGLHGPLWGTACVPYCGHKSTGALSTAKGHGLMSSKVAFLQCFQQVVEGSGSRAGLELGLGFASSPVEEPIAMERCSGEQRLEARRAAQAGGALGPGDGLARTSCPLAERPSLPAGAPCAGPGPPCTPAHAHVLLNLVPPLETKMPPEESAQDPGRGQHEGSLQGALPLSLSDGDSSAA